MKQRQQGFTLIELIMVIVILGVLSAFALPRFADLGGNARGASINGLAASVRAASNIAHAQQLADGSAAATDVNLEGQAITMIAGYPTADAAGIGQAAQIDTVNDYDATVGATSVLYVVTSATDNNTDGTIECSVTYTETANAPTVVVDVDEC